MSSILRLVEMMDSAVLGGVVEVVSSLNPARVIKYFSAFTGMVGLLYSQTCLKGSPKGRTKNGCLRQVTP